MKAVIFDVKGKVAHFRKPDTTSTQLTYPFITPTAAKGLVGAILGIEDFVTQDKVGIQLLNPVQVVAQQMSMLGKDSGSTFNRPTTIELLVNPAYRIYYVGDEHVDLLSDFLKKGQAVYHTYLGTAYSITKPIYCDTKNEVQLITRSEIPLETFTVVPTKIIEEIHIQPGCNYSRAGGFMHLYKGERTFERSIDFIYEQEGKSIKFSLLSDISAENVNVALIGEEIVCLC